jgi:DNA-binding NtrC family response regulator
MDFSNNAVDLTKGAEVSEAVIFQPGTKLDDIEKTVILETLKQQAYNRTHAARVLGIGIRTLQRKLKKYGASNLGLKSHYLRAQ